MRGLGFKFGYPPRRRLGAGAVDIYGAVVNMREQLWAEDIALANNDPVASWSERTGLAATQSVPGNQLTYKTAAAELNGKAAVHCPLDDFVSSTSLAHGIGVGDFWSLVVFSPDNISGVYNAIMGLGSFSPAWYRSFDTVDFYLGGVSHSPSVGFAMAIGGKYIWEVIRTSGSIQHYKNGAALGAAIAVAGNITNAPFHVGNDNAGSYSAMRVGRILLAAAAPTAGVRDPIIADVKSYYGIA